MKAILVTEGRIGVPPPFDALSAKSFSRIDPTGLQRWLKTGEASDAVVYLDASMGSAVLEKLARGLARKGDIAWGIYDPEGLVTDPAAAFHDGSCDWLGPGVGAGCVDAKRLRKAARLAGLDAAGPSGAEPASAAFPGWDKLVTGKEYSFILMLWKLSDAEGIRKKIGEPRFHRLREDFRALVQGRAAEANGIVWMADESGTLTLFPNPPRQGPSPVYLGWRLLLDRALIGYESFRLEIPITFTMAIHAGSAPWHEPGKTGTVVADAVNSVFHLGNKFARAGSVTVSSEAESLVPPELRGLFVEAGDYEGRRTIASLRFVD